MNEITTFLKSLREKILSAFQTLDPTAQLQRRPWNYQSGSGGGEIGEMRGEIFERAAVNFSAIHGNHFPMQDAKGPFFATGISLITHMANPHAPTVHMNLRFIQTEERFWFGGGYDLTPMGFPYEEDERHFHGVAQKTLGPELYAQFSQNAKEYFFIPHRKKERGVGGVFFDHFNRGEFSRDLALWESIGNGFLDAILPIYHRRISTPYTPEEKETQLQMRGHYVEFNLLYDRGTQFGFRSGGNPDAILCSMPPVVKW